MRAKVSPKDALAFLYVFHYSVDYSYWHCKNEYHHYNCHDDRKEDQKEKDRKGEAKNVGAPFTKVKNRFHIAYFIS